MSRVLALAQKLAETHTLSDGELLALLEGRCEASAALLRTAAQKAAGARRSLAAAISAGTTRGRNTAW